MNTSEISYIFVKILGLYMITQYLPHLVLGLAVLSEISISREVTFLRLAPSISAGVLMAIGILFVVQARAVTRLLFRGETVEALTKGGKPCGLLAARTWVQGGLAQGPPIHGSHSP